MDYLIELALVVQGRTLETNCKILFLKLICIRRIRNMLNNSAVDPNQCYKTFDNDSMRTRSTNPKPCGKLT